MDMDPCLVFILCTPLRANRLSTESRKCYTGEASLLLLLTLNEVSISTEKISTRAILAAILTAAHQFSRVKPLHNTAIRKARSRMELLQPPEFSCPLRCINWTGLR